MSEFTDFKKVLRKHEYLVVPLLINEIIKMKHGNSHSHYKQLRYYTSQFIRVNLSLLFGVSSERFGGLIMKFGDFMSQNSEIINNSSSQLLNILLDSFYENFELTNRDNTSSRNLFNSSGLSIVDNEPELLYESLKYKIVWFNYNYIEDLAKKLNSKINPLKNYQPAFSKTKKNVIDWTIAMPKADFKQYIIFDELVKYGFGFWTPVVESELVSVGFAFLINNTS
jgi:hypothetical protein